MAAKIKADFINSVANGSKIPCPECGSGNKPEARFCTTCGADISKSAATPEVLKENTDKKKENKPVEIQQNTVGENTEPISVFAEGLPEWSLEPPQIMIRRRNVR